MAQAADEPQRADEKLADALKRLLSSRGQSLRSLAGEIGVDVGFLSRAVRGMDGKVASVRLLSQIACELDVEPEWFAAVREARVIEAIKQDSSLRERLFRKLPRPS